MLECTMGLSTDHLEAFAAVLDQRSFNRAARQVGISQPSLSKRIQGLEEELGVALFIRTSTGSLPTSAGNRLYLYWQQKERLEREALADIRDPAEGQVAGSFRVAGISSVIHPVIIPALAVLLRNNNAAHAEFTVCEAVDVLDTLVTGFADFAILDDNVERTFLETLHLGYECFVAAESSTHQPRDNIYLDTGPDDAITQRFFAEKPAAEP